MESVADLQDVDCTPPYDLGGLTTNVRDFTMVITSFIITTSGDYFLGKHRVLKQLKPMNAFTF